MMQRLRDLLRPLSRQPTQHVRPNELRPEIVRAERLRREAMQREQAARAAESARERAQSRSKPGPAPGAHPSRPTTDLVAGLRSRSGLRQAIIMQEILGPPRALRRPNGPGERS